MKSVKKIVVTGLCTAVFSAAAAPQPVLLKTIDISAAGTGKRMLLGDVTGDGRLEMVMMQGNTMADDRYIGHEINCLTVFTADGEKLWQIGNPSGGAATGSDIPAQIYDIDQDGANEVLACMNGKLRIFSGTDGKEESSFSYPHPNAHDCIIIANLTGNKKPQDIILKDRYDQIWAMDRTGKQLWTYKGNTGHFPWPFDFDNDGREEIICGFDFLTPDGKKQWSMNQSGHADCVWVGDIDQDPSNGTEIATGGDDVTVYHQNGKLMWRNNQPVEPQNIAIGDFLPDQPGLEIGGQDRINRGTPGSEAIFMLSSTGKTSYYNTRSGWGSIAYRCHNWDGAGTDHLMIWRGPDKPALYNGFVEKMVSFNEGYMMAGDVNGDGRDEIIIFTESSAYIYSYSSVDLTKASAGCPAPRPQEKRHYLFTRYWGGEYMEDDDATGAAAANIPERTSAALRRHVTVHKSSGTLAVSVNRRDRQPCSFTLYDCRGKTAGATGPSMKKTVTIDVRACSAGIYVLTGAAGGARFSEKLVIR
jgi:hypothetical protein